MTDVVAPGSTRHGLPEFGRVTLQDDPVLAVHHVTHRQWRNAVQSAVDKDLRA